MLNIVAIYTMPIFIHHANCSRLKANTPQSIIPPVQCLYNPVSVCHILLIV